VRGVPCRTLKRRDHDLFDPTQDDRRRPVGPKLISEGQGQPQYALSHTESERDIRLAKLRQKVPCCGPSPAPSSSAR
jgi:hypothetical protein